MTPSRPISPSLGMISEGKWDASSHSITCGAISVSANSRTVRRSCCCSSVREKSNATSGEADYSPSNINLYHSRAGRPKTTETASAYGLGVEYSHSARFNTRADRFQAPVASYLEVQLALRFRQTVAEMALLF